MPYSFAGWPSDPEGPHFLTREQVEKLHDEALAKPGLAEIFRRLAASH